MIFNGETDGFDILTRTRFFTKVASTTDHTVKEITFSVNIWLDRVFSWILKADRRWNFDDNNQTDLPIATAALVAGQRDYGITGTEFLNILKVAVKDVAGNYRDILPVALDDPIAKDIIELRSTPGTPVRYVKNGNSIILDPAPSYASATGIRIFYQRNTVPFTTSDTTEVPGFAKPFHDILPMGAAFDYLSKEDSSRASIFWKVTINTKGESVESGLIAAMKADLIKFYSTRSEDQRPRLKLRNEDYGERGLGNGMGDMGGVRFNNT